MAMALFHLLVGREGEGLRVAAQGLRQEKTGTCHCDSTMVVFGD